LIRQRCPAIVTRICKAGQPLNRSLAGRSDFAISNVFGGTLDSGTVMGRRSIELFREMKIISGD
jgi:hypothetical protein